ncbi:UDP-N-acetylglucosamine 2-epimerase (non-hydrolyzing) [Halorubrum sp. AD140]|uniref:non-hydrolyzing UDP-N-acetylglucosamine 2-epimerase n=1 Tax=Halorubrum sp. AD140 TaxID=3050073 RepID=UPI002ACC911F|nr:UDP-N-acetylglucosamine 2-epimerase (non-hydrolyzing) [Halorubrum sp. AD140]MDZ5812516.1 UDP-N-acetylglucosamine 2-epimerase (non-hydrolyzing) [Halorubrum sp. AD140]
MKVLSVVGVRPEFIMAMPVSRVLAHEHEEVLVHTGQHYDDMLSDVFFEELALPAPAHELGVGSAPRPKQVARIRSRLAECLSAEKPDAVVVYGDTNSTLAGALTASDHDTFLVHVEAGVRSFDRTMPEERNRRLVDQYADLLLTPTPEAAQTLRAEGVSGTVHHVGDVRRDAFELVHGADETSASVHDRCNHDPGDYAVATIHRAANTDDPAVLRSLVRGLAGSRPPVVLPVHPRTEQRLREYGLDTWADTRITTVDPLGYPAFLRLISGAGCVATDSGGIQREAMLAGTPCVTLRATTEWPETVREGYNRLAGTEAPAVRRAIDASFRRSVDPPSLDTPVAPRIVETLEAAMNTARPVAESTTPPQMMD